ncbi:hypothetical protein CCE01nite_37710 [Cellulomonas cellasea]|uniref:Uncharacterized protein n=1 Tax=Cellulomonas cellasea TaxID=43670 RepID=A0A4Y3L0H5_9CELL|nr:hypothetical protein CCE01nite_37710 [Cellulomonas cellasea]
MSSQAFGVGVTAAAAGSANARPTAADRAAAALTLIDLFMAVLSPVTGSNGQSGKATVTPACRAGPEADG